MALVVAIAGTVRTQSSHVTLDDMARTVSLAPVLKHERNELLVKEVRETSNG